MGNKWKRLGIWLLGWLLSPQAVFAGVTAIIGFAWAKLANLSAPTIYLIALGALIAGLVLAHVALSLYDRLRSRLSDGASSHPDPCGDPEVRRNRIRDHAKHLNWELEHFDDWWPAIENKSFDGKLPGGAMRTTHAEAMQMLLFVFAKFFSAVRTYEVQCPRQARPRKRLMKRVREVYDALGLNGGGDTDETLNSMQLHDIGERCTKDWGKAEARPFTKAELEAAVKIDPALAESLAPVRRLLLAAGPNTEARYRLRKTEGAAKRVKERLT
jgi:hypothetical protein